MLFRNQKWHSMTLLWPSVHGEVFWSYALCHFHLYLNHTEMLFDIFCILPDKYQAVAVIVLYYSSLLTAGLGVYVNHSPCNKASSYLQCRWPSEAPRWTWGQPQSVHCYGYPPLDVFPQYEVMISSHWWSDILTWVYSVTWAGFLAATFKFDVHATNKGTL